MTYVGIRHFYWLFKFSLVINYLISISVKNGQQYRSHPYPKFKPRYTVALHIRGFDFQWIMFSDTVVTIRPSQLSPERGR